MTDTAQHPGVTIREKALEHLDEHREASAARMIPNAETAFRKFFGESISGSYEPPGEGYTERVRFDLGDGLVIWYLRDSRSGSGRSKKDPRGHTVWWLVGPCKTKRCANPRPIAKITRFADLGRELDRLEDGLCRDCEKTSE